MRTLGVHYLSDIIMRKYSRKQEMKTKRNNNIEYETQKIGRCRVTGLNPSNRHDSLNTHH